MALYGLEGYVEPPNQLLNLRRDRQAFFALRS